MTELYSFQKQLLINLSGGIEPGELMIMSAGRGTGKSHFNNILRHWHDTTRPNPTIKWKRLPGTRLQAYTDDVAPRGFERGLRDTDMDPIQQWCEECNCGKRMSFNEFKFKSEKQITMFLIRWSE